MGFQRAYMAAGDVQRMYMAEAGGFGSFLKRAFTPSKGLRKFARKAAPFVAPAFSKKTRPMVAAAAPFIPGVGPLATLAQAGMQFLPGRAQPQLVEEMEPPRRASRWSPQVIAILRSWGYDVGDPGIGDFFKGVGRWLTQPGLGSKIAAAQMGIDPRATLPRTPDFTSSGGGFDWAGALQEAAKIAKSLGGPIGKTAAGFIAPGTPAQMGPRAGGNGRRTMNPTNVRALRRSLRRVEGFKKMVKRVEKQYPALRTPAAAKRSSQICRRSK